MRIRASEAAAGIGGRLIGPDVEFEGASFDSRSTRPGQLFVPIVAERNGHEFIGAARERGATVHLTSEPDPFRRDGTAIEVADTAQALLALAEWARPRLDARVVGVTGSVGKTSTKDLMAAACGAGRRTTANERSFNNEQGLPVTILNAPDDTEVLVLEMGMRGFGEISQLCEIARPDIGVVTVVGHAHTELVGGIDGVARAPRANWSRRCRRPGRRCSTPTTNGWRRCDRVPAAAWSPTAPSATCASATSSSTRAGQGGVPRRHAVGERHDAALGGRQRTW